MKRILSIALIAMFSLVLIACGDSNESDLIGTWERDTDFGIFLITFNEDGTGTFDIRDLSAPADRFEWSVNNGTLTKEFIDLDEVDEMEYEVDGDILTLIEDGNDFIYTRVE